MKGYTENYIEEAKAKYLLYSLYLRGPYKQLPAFFNFTPRNVGKNEIECS